jgi:hypothetical protein
MIGSISLNAQAAEDFPDHFFLAGHTFISNIGQLLSYGCL